MSCILRAAGKQFKVDDFIKKSKLKPCAIYCKGEPKFKTKPNGIKNKRSGVNIEVSNTNFNNLKKQIRDAIEYLEKNKDEVKKLVKFPGLDEAPSLDFGIELKNFPLQTKYFPPELLHIAGKLGIGVEVSLYLMEK